MWPLMLSSTGPVKISPSGKLREPSALIKTRSLIDSVRSVSGPRHMHLIFAMQPVDQPLLHGALLFPGGYRVWFTEETRTENEIFILGE